EPALTTTGLSCLSSCGALEALSLESSGIDDDGLAGMEELGSLKSLDLTNCRAIDGRGLAHLAPLTGLTNLFLGGTPVTDRGLQSLSKGFRGLSEIKLQNCGKITDSAFESLVHLPRLRLLDLTGTKLSGRGLKSLDGHPALGALILSKTE